MSNTKFCKDCKHFRRSSLSVLDACKAREHIEPVRGEKAGVERAWRMRETGFECGKNAKLFEPKPPSLLSRIRAKLL